MYILQMIFFLSFLGDGLGKNRDGISDPIKASLKMDKTGVNKDKHLDLD